MDEKKQYSTPTGFKTALEARLKSRAEAMRRPYSTVRKLLAFDRLLARVFFNQDDSFALKGGYSLELRLGRSRTTKDVDLVLQSKELLQGIDSDDGEAIKALLQEKLERQMDDYFTFRLGAITPLAGATIGGYRIEVKALLIGKQFEDYHLDIAIAETDPAPLEQLSGEPWLEFAGIDQARPLAIPSELQFAEKLHAYTFPWADRENTREKDLIDMVILIGRGLDYKQTRNRIKSVFAARNTHKLPQPINPPPSSWGKVFAKYAAELGYSETLEQAFQTVKTLIDELFPVTS